MKGTASLSQKEKKRKRQALPDTRVIDNPKGYMQSKAKVAATETGTPPVSTSVEPSLAKSTKKVKSQSSEDEGKVVVTLPTKASEYSNPSFVKDVTEGLLMPADRKMLNEIGPVKTTERSLAHAYQLSVNVISEIYSYVVCNFYFLKFSNC